MPGVSPFPMLISDRHRVCIFGVGLLSCVSMAVVGARAQAPASKSQPAEPTVSKDPLGRNTPHGTVLNFLVAARKDDYETAARYLNTRRRGQGAATLARELFVVLDRGLPAQLNRVSDRPEGSLAFPADPNLDLVGKVPAESGSMDIVVERIDRGSAGSIWLFAAKTLQAIPDVYAKTTAVVPGVTLPVFLVDTEILHIPLFQWIAVFVGLPLFYIAGGQVARLLGFVGGEVWRRLRRRPQLPNPDVLPGPIRLLLLAVLIRWSMTTVSLPLLERQFWSGATRLIVIAGCVWLCIRLNGMAESYLRGRLGRRNLTGAISILRFLRRFADVLVVCVGFLVTLHSFGVNVAAAMAGLGVGGIAVALAAQKTLENVIGGVSLVFDQVVRVGDRLKIGDTEGAIEEIGLRSTRIRTLDRTVVCLPNGQLANAILENTSSRDQFWLHHIVGLRYDTTAAQIRRVIAGIGDLLRKQDEVIPDSVRVSFLRFGASSLDIELFAYVRARDFGHFFSIQESLLLQAMELVEAAGARIAIPSQVLHLAPGTASPPPEARAVAEAQRP